jgi:hypothetical protein
MLTGTDLTIALRGKSGLKASDFHTRLCGNCKSTSLLVPMLSGLMIATGDVKSNTAAECGESRLPRIVVWVSREYTSRKLSNVAALCCIALELHVAFIANVFQHLD